ncbi:hypothetical protein GCM10017044_21940 [Kordiimonas sediminis]|uniref:Tetratricopeptide repeat protein n=1 Tax=Kordiimonas sediminis TaxID=1735581 RepID=A0A919E9N5_9PROT|nr:tetratricopeptide repeat protein [Kordiimonas sediminis]GHF26561.1 hypothetical protein GCM10017044_21940 [Kordiimonas sediminis]
MFYKMSLPRKTFVATLAAFGLMLISTTAKAQVIHINFDSNIKKAVQALNAKDLNRASLYFHRALDGNLSDDHLIATLNNVCAVDYAIGSLDTAKKACDDLLAKDRINWRGYVNRGNVHAAQGDYDLAKLDYDKAYSLKPDNVIVNAAITQFTAMQEGDKHLRTLAANQ